MTWIILEGLDRSGKSSVADSYAQKGFEVIHMNAPDKKYFRKGYAGPSYLEEMLDLYTKYAGKDVVFDRSAYGELVWPEIFNRTALLVDEDFDYLQQIENNNDTTRILMFDENKDAHWQRCVDNNEPLTKQQFMHASRLYESLAKDFNFEWKQLNEFIKPQKANSTNANRSSGTLSAGSDVRDDGAAGNLRQPTPRTNTQDSEFSSVVHSQLDKKIERANAIRDLLSSTIIKKKGRAYSDLEKDVRQFLEQQLENIFNEPKKDDFTEEEIKILKIYAQRIREKLG
jgi:thymidylate kinase